MPIEYAKGYYAQGGYSQEDRVKLEKQIKAREKKYGYKRGSNASLTKPSKYANIADGDFADPVGFNYPIDKGHIQGALTYWNQPKNRKFYKDPKALAFITERIIRAALKFGKKVTYQPNDAQYRNLPESLKKQLQGYGTKSFLEDSAGFAALQAKAFSQKNQGPIPLFS